MQPLSRNALVAILSVALKAQVGTATLSGVITDSTGAIIPDAEIILSHVEQQSVRKTVSGTEGQYVIPAIPPGSYKLTVKKEGFPVLAVATSYPPSSLGEADWVVESLRPDEVRAKIPQLKLIV